MRVVAKFSIKDGERYISSHFPKELAEVYDCIKGVDAALCKNKKSKEVNMVGKMLYSPPCFNKAFEAVLYPLGWEKRKIECNYNSETFINGVVSKSDEHTGSREMDFVKSGVKLGIEVQFGKYAFMAYNICAKMTIFHNLGIIDAGIEIVAVRELTAEMSSGVSYYEQLEWDMRMRGTADIDIPVLVLGVAS